MYLSQLSINVCLSCRLHLALMWMMFKQQSIKQVNVDPLFGGRIVAGRIRVHTATKWSVVHLCEGKIRWNLDCMNQLSISYEVSIQGGTASWWSLPMPWLSSDVVLSGWGMRPMMASQHHHEQWSWLMAVGVIGSAKSGECQRWMARQHYKLTYLFPPMPFHG